MDKAVDFEERLQVEAAAIREDARRSAVEVGTTVARAIAELRVSFWKTVLASAVAVVTLALGTFVFVQQRITLDVIQHIEANGAASRVAIDRLSGDVGTVRELAVSATAKADTTASAIEVLSTKQRILESQIEQNRVLLLELRTKARDSEALLKRIAEK